MKYLLMIYGNQENWDTKELCEEAAEKYHAIEGGQQTLSKLVAYVTQIVRKGAEN